jgi:hypothetical protein
MGTTLGHLRSVTEGLPDDTPVLVTSDDTLLGPRQDETFAISLGHPTADDPLSLYVVSNTP